MAVTVYLGQLLINCKVIKICMWDIETWLGNASKLLKQRQISPISHHKNYLNVSLQKWQVWRILKWNWALCSVGSPKSPNCYPWSRKLSLVYIIERRERNSTILLTNYIIIALGSLETMDIHRSQKNLPLLWMVWTQNWIFKYSTIILKVKLWKKWKRKFRRL